MTFYWWSHWFWITLLTYFVVLRTANVHTYPHSQEISDEYNDNPRASTGVGVTKLYQASTTTFARPTAAPSSSGHKGQPKELPSNEQEDDTEYPQVDANEGDVEMESPIEDNGDDEIGDFEFKRSAEALNKTAESAEMVKKNEDLNGNNTSKERLKANGNTEISNYTNFSRPISSNSSLDTETLGAHNVSTSTGVEPKENVSTTLAWLNAVAAVTVSEDREPETTAAHKAPFTLENVNKEEELRRAENEHRTRKSKGLSAEYKHVNRYTDSKNLLTRSAATATATSPNEYDNDGGNISSEALAIQRTYFLDAGAISAICFTVFGFCCTVGTIGIVLYRRRFLNKPQALSEPDSSVYIDDSTMRDNSDEMYSLDNDSFLNSLEAMTIQNYWTDTVKHTKL